jgi:fructokinase
MQPPLVIGLGELLWDLFPDARRPGGAPANVAYHTGQLGNVGAVASRVGADAAGDEIVQFLSARGIETSLVQRDANRPTGRVTVELDASTGHRFIIHEDVAWDALEPTETLREAMTHAAAVCFGTLAQRSLISRETIHTLLPLVPRTSTVVFDVNLRQHWYHRDSIERSLRLAQVVKLNDDELPVLADLLKTGRAEPSLFAEELRRRYGVRTVVVTRGGQGCIVCGNGEVLEIPGRPVQVIDTVGAGDAFTAGFITGLLRGWPLARVGDFANRIGGLVASRAGAMPDLRAELEELRGEFPFDG